MLQEEIVVGKTYANERTRVLREVVEEVDGQRVKFNAFELGSGRLLPSRHRVCPSSDMADWAQREASPAERALIHPYGPEGSFEPPTPLREQGMHSEAAKASLKAAATPHMFPQPR